MYADYSKIKAILLKIHFNCIIPRLLSTDKIFLISELH